MCNINFEYLDTLYEWKCGADKILSDFNDKYGSVVYNPDEPDTERNMIREKNTLENVCNIHKNNIRTYINSLQK